MLFINRNDIPFLKRILISEYEKDLKVEEKEKEKTMKKLLNLKKKTEFMHEKLLNSQEVRFLRKYLIKSAALAPQYIYGFCLIFQKIDKIKLNEFTNKIYTDATIKNFIVNQDKFWMNIILNLDFNHKKIFNEIFDKDKIYEHLGRKISEFTKCTSLYYIYYAVNYIEDNFPITRNKELSEEEKKLVKFLLYKGGINDYIEKYKISKEGVEKLIHSICNNYDTKDINHALNLILIEKYIRDRNNRFLNTINYLKSRSKGSEQRLK